MGATCDAEIGGALPDLECARSFVVLVMRTGVLALGLLALRGQASLRLVSPGELRYGMELLTGRAPVLARRRGRTSILSDW